MSTNKKISRRNFLKTIGSAAVATTGLAACVKHDKSGTSVGATGKIPTGQMTYRTIPTSGDKVSLLGFGMMRLPSVGGRSAREGNEEIDQEMVNELVDYAIAHGVSVISVFPITAMSGCSTICFPGTTNTSGTLYKYS